jgi:cob(I)alamin adenosyltransferase
MAKGLIHIYTGDGKGKTTASFGLAIRAAGHGKKVLVLQFLKSKVKNAGEIKFLKDSNIKIIRFKAQTTPLFSSKVRLTDLRRSIKRAIDSAIKHIESKEYDLVILDEFNPLLSSGLASMEDVNRIIDIKPDALELVFTGRGAPEGLIKIADYVTEMRMVKHPFNRGIKARRAIEF